jgi:hypothetical protein
MGNCKSFEKVGFSLGLGFESQGSEIGDFYLLTFFLPLYARRETPQKCFNEHRLANACLPGYKHHLPLSAERFF